LTAFDEAFDYMLANEVPSGNIHEVVDNPNDHGGITKYGISLRFLKSLHPLPEVSELIDEADIKKLTLIEAKAIYKTQFWDNAPFEKIEFNEVRNYLFDMAVNMGIAPAIKCAQRACWAVCGMAETLTDDGICGDNTLHYIHMANLDLLYPLRAERANYYRMIVERNPSQAVFLEGWLNRAYRQ
jgi:lysozyme family protein